MIFQYNFVVGYVELILPSGNKSTSISIQSLEGGDWHSKWSGLIECIDPDDGSVHGGMYIYAYDMPPEADRIFSLNKEQVKIDVSVQPVEKFFKVHVSMQDLKSLDSIFLNFMTTINSVGKYSDIVKSTNSTWLFIRTVGFIFHCRMDMQDSTVFHSSYSALQ